MIDEAADVTTRTRDLILDGRRELAQQLSADNDRRIEAVKARGVQLDAAIFAAARFDVLCNQLLGPLDGDDATAARVDYEVACQKRFAQILSDVESQVTRALLLNGVRQNPGP